MRMAIILATAWYFRTSSALTFRPLAERSQYAAFRIGTTLWKRPTQRVFSVSKGSIEADVKVGVSRIETLQKMLSKHGAPGSLKCSEPDDLLPIYVASAVEGATDEIPELISTITGANEYDNLHPHLYPLAKSKSTGNLVCALRRAFADDALEWYEKSAKAPWPIVETTLGGPGMRLLALNSEHLMRRIVCECDFKGERRELIDLYNENLGKNQIQDAGLDQPYEIGSVEKLGYGVDKYVLLRVGPFPDIYESLAQGHAEKGDESSALISAEAANNKISGFGSTFLFYAKLLNSFPNRSEEARDAARMCLRMPLPSIGLNMEDFRQVAILGQMADSSDSDEELMAKLQARYEKIRQHENEDPRSGNNDMSPEQRAMNEANYLLDTVAMTGSQWSDARPKLADIYKSVGREDMATFVCPRPSS